MLLFIIFHANQSSSSAHQYQNHVGDTKEGQRGSLEDSAHAHTCRLKRSRLRLTRMAFKGAWGCVPSWIGPKFGQLIPLLVIYLPIKFCSNQRLEACVATGDNFSFWLQKLPRGTFSLGFGQNFTSIFLMWCSTPL